jgi:hypothetical protein
MAVLMASYESNEKHSAFVDLTEYIEGRDFDAIEMPEPDKFGTVFQKK